MGKLLRIIVPIWLSGAALIGADASPARHEFEGSCAIVGHAELADPMTPVPSQSSFRFAGEGVCAGTMDGSVLPERGVPVSYASRGPRNVHSCAVGLDVGVTWELTFPRGGQDVVLRGTAHIIDLLRFQESLVLGQGGGVAVAENTIQGHGEALQRCMTEGSRAGSVAIQLDTLTPLASED